MDEKRKRGRPKLEEPRVSIATWLRAGEHDRLIQIANREAKSLSALVRELVERKIRTS